MTSSPSELSGSLGDENLLSLDDRERHMDARERPIDI